MVASVAAAVKEISQLDSELRDQRTELSVQAEQLGAATLDFQSREKFRTNESFDVHPNSL
jgi:hypothetical protein